MKKYQLILFPFAAAWVIFCAASMFLTEKNIIRREPVTIEPIVKKSRFIEKGWEVWLNEGREGYRNSVFREYSLAGTKLHGTRLYESRLIKKPVQGFMLKGISGKKNPVTAPKVTYAQFTHKMEATAYDSSPEDNTLNWAGITKLGWRTRHGIAAVDPKVIALRSLIYVEGYGFAWTGDTGGAIKGNRIDLCYNTTQEALDWGRKKNVKVYVLSSKPQSWFREKNAKKQK